MALGDEAKYTCDGCDKEMQLLQPHVSMMLKIERSIPQINQTSSVSDDGEQLSNVEISFATQSGRGVMRKFHDFKCLEEWVQERTDYEPKIQIHYEDGDPYVPEDNRSPEELVEAGELPPEVLDFNKATADFTPGGE